MIELLNTSGPYAALLRGALCFAGLWCLLFTWRLLRQLFNIAPRLSLSTWVIFGLLSVCAELMRPVMIDLFALYQTPVYESTFLQTSEDGKAAAFERELQRHVSASEFQVIQSATVQTAAKIGCKPSDIYAVAYSECGLDPFNVRGDKVAAGWIQFTSAGVGSTPGLTLRRVIRACDRREVDSIMVWTDNYLMEAVRTSGQLLTNAADVYLAVFAPAKIGKRGVLYEGRNNPAYYLNSGIDGWVRQTDGRILRQQRAIDYKITDTELSLMLEYKAAKLLQKQY